MEFISLFLNESNIQAIRNHRFVVENSKDEMAYEQIEDRALVYCNVFYYPNEFPQLNSLLEKLNV